MTKHEVFDALKARNAIKAVIEFSGGGDEGGADSIVLLDAEGAEVGELDPYGMHSMSEHVDGKWVLRTPSEDAGLIEALLDPIEQEYGGFAGDFQVSGTVTWDATTGKATMSKSEMSWESAPHEEYEV